MHLLNKNQVNMETSVNSLAVDADCSLKDLCSLLNHKNGLLI